MARKKPTGQYQIRLVVLSRVIGAKLPNGEDATTWPDPTAGTNEYFAGRDALTGAEQIVQGLQQSTGGMRLRIKGRAIAINAYDRVKIKTTGELYNVTGVSREFIDTVISIERVYQQTTGQ